MDKYKIYPKQYRNEKITIQKNKCFVLMQFSDDLDIVYGTIKNEKCLVQDLLLRN